MEGSVATQAGTAGAGGAENAQGIDAAPDMAQLAQTLEGQQQGQQELRQIVTDMASQLSDFTAAQAGAGDGDGTEGEPGDEFNLDFLEDQSLDPAAMAGHLQGLIDTRAKEIAASQVNPLAQRLDAAERRAELSALVDEVPEMKDEKIAQQVVQTTATLADAYGWPDHLKQDPKMYRMVYLASKAMEITGEEGDGSDGAVATLEGGGGARPAGVQQGQDLGDAIVGARKGRSALPFG